MAKVKTAYRCTECGAEHSKWQGRCDQCGEWNTLVEEIVAPRVVAATASARRGRASLARRRRISDGPLADEPRRIRLRARRGNRPRLDDSRRRRAGDRQIDALAASRG